MEDSRTIRDMITDTIVRGFLACGVSVSYRVDGDETLIFVSGAAVPIRVLPLDVIVPEELANVADGIRLDVAAVLSQLEG